MSNQKKPSSGKILIVDDEPDMLGNAGYDYYR